MIMKNKTILPITRIYWLDVVRTIAIISITMNHAVSRTFDVYGDTMAEFNTIPVLFTVIKSVLYCFSRLGVPLFLMISGALLLPRNYTEKNKLEKFIKHNWFNLFITTEIWLAIMYWFLQLGSSSILRTEGFLPAFIGFIKNQLFIDQVTFGSMWYMPMILCVYLMIPIFSLAVNKIDKGYFIIPMTIAMVSGMIIPTWNAAMDAVGSNASIDIALSITDLFSIYFIYVFIGYFISQGLMKQIPNYILILGIILPFVLVCVFQFWIYTTPSNYAVRYQSFGLLISASCLFEIMRRKDNDLLPNKIVTEISKISFGIYFLHIIVMTLIEKIFSYIEINVLLKVFILEIASIALSVITIEVVKRFSFLKKWLFMIKD